MLATAVFILYLVDFNVVVELWLSWLEWFNDGVWLGQSSRPESLENQGQEFIKNTEEWAMEIIMEKKLKLMQLAISEI